MRVLWFCDFMQLLIDSGRVLDLEWIPRALLGWKVCLPFSRKVWGILGYGLWQLAGSLVHFVGEWLFTLHIQTHSLGILVVTWTIGFLSDIISVPYCMLVLF